MLKKPSLRSCALLACAFFTGCSAGSPSPSPSGQAGTDASGGSAGTGAQSGSGAGVSGASGLGAGGGASGSASGSAGAGVAGAGVAGTGAAGAAGASGSAGAGVSGAAGSAGAAGSSGSAGSAGSGGPPASSIIVQDNFDTSAASAAPNATRWAGYPTGQEALGPKVDTMRAHSGANAALVSSTSAGLGSFLVPASGLPVTGNVVYVRAYMNWEKATAQVGNHSAFIVGSDARDESGTEVRLGMSANGPGNVERMDLNLQNPKDGQGGEVTRYSNGFTDGGNPADFPGMGFQFAANKWYCVEALFNGTPNASEFRVWVDSAEIMEMHVTDFRGNTSGTPRVNWAPTYSYIKIGANDYSGNIGKVWYDDVVVATQPIGCAYVVP